MTRPIDMEKSGSNPADWRRWLCDSTPGHSRTLWDRIPATGVETVMLAHISSLDVMCFFCTIANLNHSESLPLLLLHHRPAKVRPPLPSAPIRIPAASPSVPGAPRG